MSKRSAVALHKPLYRYSGTGVFISRLSLVASRADRCAKLRLMARYAALAVLAAMQLRIGGAYRDRTDDLMLAKQPLSQLS